MTSRSPSKAPRVRRWLARLALVAAVVALGVEIGLRWLLFSDLGWVTRLAGTLRQPGLFTDAWSDDEFWQLMQRLDGEPGPLPDDMVHAELGWHSKLFDPATYVHVDAAEVGERRPVLLFGDSFAQCNTKPLDCFQGVLARSDLAADYALLNYGVRAYGLDQVYLLAQRVLDQWAEENPIVVVGIYVDDDLDRSYLGFRGWPKPHLVQRDGVLSVERERLPTLEEYRGEHGIEIASYAWRYLLHAPGVLPESWQSALRGDAARQRAKEELNAAILDGLLGELRTRELEHFVWLFQGPEASGSIGPHDWREEFLLDYLQQNKVPFVSAKAALQADALASRRPLAAYFGTRGDIKDHYLPFANEVAFRALRDGLEGRFELRHAAAPPPISAFEETRGEDGRARVRYEQGHSAAFPDDLERLFMTVSEGETTRIVYRLDGRCSSFSALAKLPARARDPERCGRVGFALHADDETLVSGALTPQSPEQRIEVDLRGKRVLVLDVDDGGDGAACDLLYFAGPSFR